MASDTDALQQQLFQFSEPAFEQMQGAIDRRRSFHVDICSLQCLQRKFRAAGTQKIQISLNTSWRTGEYALRKRHSGGDSSRIFVNVERVVEVRDPEAFQIKFGINDEVLGKIRFEQFVIFRFENVEG